MSKEVNLSCGPTRLILRKIDTRIDKTEAGIILPKDGAQDGLESKGTVLAVGEDVRGFEIGDVVHHGFHSGTVFNYKEEALLSINDYEILAGEKKSK